MEDSSPSAQRRPLRVLNLIDGLGGGGSERLLWDTVRLTDPARIQHRVATVSPDWFGDFHYAERMGAAGAYSRGSRTRRSQNGSIPLLGWVRDFMRKASPGLSVAAILRFTFQLAALAVTFPRSVIAVLRHRPDVLHTHTFYGFVHGIGIGFLLRVPVIHTVPCLFSQMRTAGFGWLPWCYRRLNFGVRKFLTGASVEELRRSGIDDRRIVKLEGGVDLAPLAAAAANRASLRTSVRIKLGVPVDSLLAISIGRLHGTKGQRHAIAALALVADEFPGLHLAIFGEGGLRDDLAALAKSHGVESRVRFAGFWEDPLEACAAADLYLRTHLLEGDNLSSLQAIGLAVPAVGFDTGSEIDVIRSAGAGIVVPVGDEKELANAVRQILSRKDRGAPLGGAGADYVRKHLGISSMLSAYEGAYREVQPEEPVRQKSHRLKALWLAKIAVTASVLFFIFVHFVDRGALARAAAEFPVPALAALVGFAMVQRGIVAWQTGLALDHAGVRLSTARVFKIHLVTSFFSVVFPGELAGAAVSWHLFSRDSGLRTQTAAALVYLRLVGYFLMAVVAAGALIAEPRLLGVNAHWAVLTAALVFGLPLLSFHFRVLADGLSSMTARLTGVLPWRRPGSAFESFWVSVRAFAGMPLKTQARVWLAAAAAYAVNVAAGLVAMQAANVEIPFSAVIWLLAVVTLLSLVPFTIGGFGVRELGVAVVLERWYGVPTETAVLLSLALGVVGLIVSLGFGGLAVLTEVGSRGRPSEPAVRSPDSRH